jgi:Fe2+ transport system protein FeoA
MESVLEREKRLILSRRILADAGNGMRGAEISLDTLKSGDYGTVSRMEGDEEFRGKMLALGIIPGKTITVARGEKHQPYVLRVDESRVMMDWATLSRIYVHSGSDMGRKGGKMK